MRMIAFLLLLLLLLLVTAIGCTTVQMDDVPEGPADSTSDKMPDDAAPKTSETPLDSGLPEWMTIEFTDLNSGLETSIASLDTRPILLESFAVWCPTCKKQQLEIKKLHEEFDVQVLSIGLDTDPNEDEEIVKEFIDSNGFDWIYAISPVDMTRSLISEFGNSIVNAPSAPVILICDGTNYRKLPNGVKTADELAEEIKAGC